MRSLAWTRTAATVALAAVTVACAATQPVRTLPKGQSAVVASFGGPWQPKKSPTVVVPYVTLGIMRGLSDQTTLVYDVHVLMAALGVAGADVGLAHRLRVQDGAVPEITALGQAYLFAGSGGTRLFPHASVNASWTRGARQLLYVGGDAIGQFTGAPAVLVAPLAGWQFPVRQRVQLQTEFKWMAANVQTEHGIFRGRGNIGGHGGLSVQLGVQVTR
jgi:hypothetical protein